MTALCCINVAPLLATHASTKEHSHWEHCGNTVQSVCTCVCSYMPVLCELVLLSEAVSLHISRMISLTWAPQGLVILVISSTCRSIVAASGRPNNAGKKEEPPPCSHHQCMTRSVQKLAINKPMRGVRDLLKHLKQMKSVKNGETETCYICICINRGSMNVQVTVEGFFFSSQPPVGETDLAGELTGDPLHTGLTD